MAKIYVFLADGCEEVEALTPVDLIRRAGHEVCMVSVMGRKQITGSHGIRIEADVLLEDEEFDEGDMYLLPGGMPGTRYLGESRRLAELLLQRHAQGKHLAAICAAPSVLGDLGLLAGKKATCHPGFESHLLKAQVVEDEVAADGNVVTSRGLGTAIPFGLQLIRCLADEETAQKVQDAIVYRK